ncbi:MAG: MarR family transcriptional regulator [Chitinophagaceae bacterium]
MLRKECDKVFRQEGFPVEMDQVPVVMLLYYSDRPLTQQEIYTRLERDKASVNRTISFLNKIDIVRVVQDDSDKRKTRVELTVAGKELAARADDIIKKIDTNLLASLTTEEQQQFSILITKLIETSFT